MLGNFTQVHVECIHKYLQVRKYTKKYIHVGCWVIKLLGCSPSLRLFTPLLYTWFTKSFVTVVHVDNCSSSFEPRRLYVDHGIRTIVQHSLIIIDNCSAQLVVADKKWALFQQDSVANGGERRMYIGSIAQEITGRHIATSYIATANIATAYIAARRSLPGILRGGEYIAAQSKRHDALQEPTLSMVRSKEPLFIFDILSNLVF